MIEEKPFVHVVHDDRKGSLYLSPRQDPTILRLCGAVHPTMKSDDRKGCHDNSQTLRSWRVPWRRHGW